MSTQDIEHKHKEAQTLLKLAEAFDLLSKNPFLSEDDVRKLFIKYKIIEEENPTHPRF